MLWFCLLLLVVASLGLSYLILGIELLYHRLIGGYFPCKRQLYLEEDPWTHTLWLSFSPILFFLYRSTITENCLLKCRRPWAPSQMILYVTLQLVSLTCSYIPTMLCISAAKKDCSSITIIRTLQSWALQETLFERRGMELSSLGPTFQAQGCETGLPLAGKSGIKELNSLFEETKLPKSALYLCLHWIRRW